MTTFKNWVRKNAFKLTNALALLLVIQTANTACTWFAYQPKLPEQAYRLKK